MAVFRVEKTKDFTIMSNHHLRNPKLSLKAKGLLSLMLSLPEDWDYTTKGLAQICKEGVDSIGTALKELERYGYLTRRRLRCANGQLGDIEYTIHETPAEFSGESRLPKRENPEQVNPEQVNSGQENPKQAKSGQENPRQEKPVQLNTNIQKTDELSTKRSRTDLSIYPSSVDTDGMDGSDLVKVYRKIIKKNVEYECLVSRYGKERMDETVELILETVVARRSYIRIAGEDYPKEIVKSRFLKLNSGHLEYVFECMDRNTAKIGNIKAYLLAALYNAPATMDSYYRAEVNHDLYGLGYQNMKGGTAR